MKFTSSAAIALLVSIFLYNAGEAANSDYLITEAEHAAYLESLDNAPLEVFRKSLSPTIVVESPALDSGELSGPVDIIVRFSTTDGETIDMDSLNVSYGFFMDITDRILEGAELGDSYFKVFDAKLPSGKHSFTIRIKDSQGREAEKKIDVSVV